MFSLIWVKDLITAAKATSLSFQPGAGPVQGVVLPLRWPGSRSPSNSAVRWLGHALGDISFLQLDGGVREGGQNAGEAKRIRVSQVSSGVGLSLGCGCFGQSHQVPSGFQACG